LYVYQNFKVDPFVLLTWTPWKKYPFN